MRFGIIGDPFLKEVGLPLKGNHFHEFEWIGGIVVLGVSKRDKQAISDKFYVLTHQGGIHSDESNRKSIWNIDY